MERDPEKRFWDKVDKRGPNDCWKWQASQDGNGYGLIVVHGKRLKAHRVSWELLRGPIPNGMCVLHRCGNRSCVNPAHLFLGVGNMKRALEERFWEKVDKKEPDDCWIWQGCGDGRYGGIKSKGRMLKAHRVSWELANGPIPEGMCVLHHCDNPACVNPAHLFLGTHTDNMRDKEEKGRGVHLRGKANGYAKLSERDVREIRAMLAKGILQQTIANKYCISKSEINNINRGEVWGWSQ